MLVVCDTKLVALLEVPHLSDCCETVIFKSTAVHRRLEPLTSLL